MFCDKNLQWHMLAIATIIFWGTSFVSTKYLLGCEFSAVQIFTIRFVFTYLILLVASHKKLCANSLKHELIFLVCGITGCTLYFWFENTALSLSPSSNVSLIVCTNPLLIMIIGGIIYKSERLRKLQILGCIVTFIGMVLVVLNGRFALKLSIVGDLFAFVSAIVWAIYSLVIRQFNDKYSTLFVTRKIFFYGSITSIPIMLIFDKKIPWSNFLQPLVALNFLCLTIFCSLFGYLIWNKVLKQLGTVLASNYIYAIPLTTMLTAVVAINERITPVTIIGAVAIIVGMFLAERRSF